MRVYVCAIAILAVLAGCKHYDSGSPGTPQVITDPPALTGKVKTQRLKCAMGSLGVAVFTVELAELDTRDWKVMKMEIKLPNSETVTLSQRFIAHMWFPAGARLAPPAAKMKDGTAILAIQTGDGGD
jgi:hypothetical protein